MTRSTRVVLVLAVLVAISSVAIVWTAAGTDSTIQEEPQTASDSFQVENMSAPPSVVQGDMVTVTATISYSANATATGATETEAGATETEAGATETEAGATETEAGATETVTTETEGTGAAEGETQLVEFRINGDVVDRQEVTLASGESTEVSFEVDTSEVEPGIYVHGVYTEKFGEQGSLIVTQSTGNETPEATETGEMTETATPVSDEGTEAETTATEMETATETETMTETETATEPEQFYTSPSFDVRNMNMSSEVTHGDTVNVTAEVFYPSDAADNATETAATETEVGATETEAGVTETEVGATETEIGATETAAGEADNESLTQTVQFRVQGDVYDEQNVTLAPGESETVTFEFDTSDVESGIYVNAIFTRDYGEVQTLVIMNESAADDGATATESDGVATETPGSDTGGEEEGETPTPTETEADTANEA